MSDIASEITNSVAADGQTTISGTIDFNGNKIVLDVDGDTSITSDTDDQIDFEIAGADDFRIIANIFQALSGSSIETDTINETTADNGVVVDGVTIKDSGIIFDTVPLAAYDVGTWTPNLTDLTNSASYNSREGTYTKIGRVIYWTCYMDISSLGSLSTSLYIDGLPEASATISSDSYGPGSWTAGTALNITPGQVASASVLHNNLSRVDLLLWDAATGSTRLQHGEIKTGEMSWAGWYLV